MVIYLKDSPRMLIPLTNSGELQPWAHFQEFVQNQIKFIGKTYYQPFLRGLKNTRAEISVCAVANTCSRSMEAPAAIPLFV